MGQPQKHPSERTKELENVYLIPSSHWLRVVEGGKGHKFLGPSGSPVPSSNMLALGNELTLEFTCCAGKQRDPR